MTIALTATAGVASASASSEFIAENYPINLEGTGTYGASFDFKVGGAERSCDVPVLNATLNADTTTLATSPEDTTCWFDGERTLKMNGCEFIFHPDKREIEGVVDGTYDIGGSECSTGPTITYYLNACTLTILPQTGLEATFENKGTPGKSHYVRIGLIDKEIEMHNSSSFCYGGKGYLTGEFTGHWNVKEPNEEDGFYLEPEFVGTEIGIYTTGTPAFAAEDYPVLASGEEDGDHTFYTRGTATCKEVRFESEYSSEISELPLLAEYGKCWAFGLESTVEMNGCELVLTTASQEAGAAGVSCSGEETVEITAFLFGEPVCVVSIGQQSGLEGVEYAEVGSGNERGVEVNVELEGIEYTQGGVFCPEPGTFEDGTYSGVATLYGMVP